MKDLLLMALVLMLNIAVINTGLKHNENYERELLKELKQDPEFDIKLYEEFGDE